jgi:hypothetical protein
MTGTRKLSGFWRGLYIKDTNNSLNRLTHLTIEYAGAPAWGNRSTGANLTIYEPDGGRYGARETSEATSLSLDNVALENSRNAGVYIFDENTDDSPPIIETINLLSCKGISFAGNGSKVVSPESDDRSAWTSTCGTP